MVRGMHEHIDHVCATGSDASRAADDLKEPRPYLTQKEMDREYRSAIEPRLQERYGAASRWTGSGSGSWLVCAFL